MAKVFSKTQLFHMLPGTHRLFLWFRLCITLHSRDYNQAPDIRAFAVAADTVRESNGRPAFEGLLGCGICSAYQSKKKKKPWPWTALSQHFDAHNSFKRLWPEKLLVLPTTADIIESCSKIEDKIIRRRWIELFKEADEGLGGMLDDGLRLEEDAARSKAIQDEKVRRILGGERDQANHPQSQKRRREADLLRSPEGGGDDKEKRLKVGSGGYKNVPVPSFSNIPSWETHRGPTSTTPLAGAREPRDRETTVKYVEALPSKPVEIPPVVPRVVPPIERAPRTAAKPAAVLPMKPFTTPLERARETRAPEAIARSINVLPRKPVEMPPAILPRDQESRAPEVIARPVKVLSRKPVEMPPARARETRAPEIIATSVNVLPRKPPTTSPAMARENRVPEAIARSAKTPSGKPPTAFPERARETRAPEVIATSVKILPTKPPTAPPARETRAPETAAKSVGVPPVIPPSAGDSPAREKIADPKPNKPPEIHRDRSPSVDVDIEALFADA